MSLVIEDDHTFRFEYPEADKLAKDEGYGDWWEAFLEHWESQLKPTPRSLPVLARWIQKEIDAKGMRLFDLNPFYWEVDLKGNQLPYVDYYQRVLVGSKEHRGLESQGVLPRASLGHGVASV